MIFIPMNGHIYVEIFDIKNLEQKKQAEALGILLPEGEVKGDQDYEFVKVKGYEDGGVGDLTMGQILVVEKHGLREIEVGETKYLILNSKNYIIGEVRL